MNNYRKGSYGEINENKKRFELPKRTTDSKENDKKRKTNSTTWTDNEK